MSTSPYHIDYSADALEHLRGLTANQRNLILDAVEEQLRHQPAMETKNRKLMRPNLYAQWELRVRNLRVYYKVFEDPEQLVLVCGIGIKVRNQVWIGGEEVDFQ
jgi:mRNA-degrading endonuclease RelE of RelBE toxin-antitoxin system